MTNCICLVQEGQISQQCTERLDAGLRDIAARNDLGSEVNIAWITIPKGQGWTAGKPSTSSVVTMMAPPIEQAHRVSVLHEICDLWTDTTDCHINEVIASVIPTA